MTRDARYARFEAITVGAAARVLRAGRDALILPGEAEFYLRELVELDAHAAAPAHRSLRRLAQRRCPAGVGDVPLRSAGRHRRHRSAARLRRLPRGTRAAGWSLPAGGS